MTKSAKSVKHNRRMLIQVGLRILILIILILLLIRFFVDGINKVIYTGFYFYRVYSLFGDLDDLLERYPFCSSLFDYWDEHDTVYSGASVREDELPADDDEFRSLPSDLQSRIAGQVYDEVYLRLKHFYDENALYHFYIVDVTDEDSRRICFSYGDDEAAEAGSELDRLFVEDRIISGIRNGEFYTDEEFFFADGVMYSTIYAPVTQGDTVDYVYVCVYDCSMPHGLIVIMLQASGLLLLIILMLLIYLLLYIHRIALRPILQIQKNVKNYMGDMDSDKFLENMGKIRSKNEVGELSKELSDMIVKIEDYNNTIIENAKEKTKTEYELNLASKVQVSMLPKTLPSIEGYKLSASMTPAEYVAGDFYDAFMADDTHLCLVVADVTGKGVYAALLAASVQTSIRYNTRPDLRPSQILSKLNYELVSKDFAGVFVTVWMGILDTTTGILTTSSAGHECPMLMTNGNYQMYRDTPHGLPAGSRIDTEYTDHEIRLKAGESIFVYTDGVTDAVDKEDNRFGNKNLVNALNANKDLEPDELLTRMRSLVIDDYSSGASQFDDITMMCLKCTE